MRSLVSFGVRKPVPVNLLMAAILVGGGVLGVYLRREFFPETTPDRVLVSLPYPGASPEEIEDTLAIKVENKLRAQVDQIKEMKTNIAEGGGSVLLEFNAGTNVDDAYEDCKRAIDSLTDLPDEAERIQVQMFEPRLPVIQVAMYGNMDEAVMKRAIRGVRDDLRSLPNMGEMTLGGVRDYEISVDVRREAMLRQGVSLPEVTDVIRAWMRDIPGGTVRTNTGDIKVRTMGTVERARAIRKLVVRSDTRGRTLRVGDIARVREGFVDEQVINRHDGQPAANLTVFKVGDQDIVHMAQMVRAYVAGRKGKTFSPGLLGRFFGSDRQAAWRLGRQSPHPLPTNAKLDLTTDLARFVDGRLNLLLRNACYGAVLVFLTLLVFLNWRAAMWVGVGLITAVTGTIVLMYALGITLNLLTMFGLIIVLGLLVDDAIVVAENIQTLHDGGTPALAAAVEGTHRVFWPVVATVITSIVAFLPLTFIRGHVGDLLGALPMVVACSLAMSLVEAMLILPSHMGHTLAKRDRGRAQPTTPPTAPSPRADEGQDASEPAAGEDVSEPAAGETASPGALGHDLWRQVRGSAARWIYQAERQRDHLLYDRLIPAYARGLDKCLRRRYVSIAVAVALVILTLGLVVSGRAPFTFMPDSDSETIVINVNMPVGTAVNRTDAVVQRIEQAAQRQPETRSVSSQVGQSTNLQTSKTQAYAPNVAQMFIELQPVEKRQRQSSQVIDSIRRAIAGHVDEAQNISFTQISGGPGGADITIRARGNNRMALEQTANDLKRMLGRFHGVYDIADDNDLGQAELTIRVKPAGKALGFTTANVAQQVRGALYGLKAHTYADREEDIDVRVRLDTPTRRSLYAMENIWLISPNGSRGAGGAGRAGGKPVPLSEIADIEDSQTYSMIHRIDGERAVTVTAETAPAISPESIVQRMTTGGESGARPARLASAGAAGTAGARTAGLSPLDQVRQRHPGVTLEFAGRQEQLSEAFDSLPLGFAAAILLIYVTLAWLFSSYLQPLVVLLAVPFSVIGVVFGHMLLGYDITFLSLIGFVALSGIVVNDSLIFVEFYNEQRANGVGVHDSLVAAGRARFRAILLTTLTTVLGLAPLIAARSWQARFLIPMAIAIAFGLLSATVLTLVILPCFILVFSDVRDAASFLWHGEVRGGSAHPPSPQGVEAASP